MCFLVGSVKSSSFSFWVGFCFTGEWACMVLELSCCELSYGAV